jgi:hypothetical protein
VFDAKMSPREAQDLEKANLERCKKFVEAQRLSNAIKALTSQGVAEMTPEVINILREKHPEAERPRLPDGPIPGQAVRVTDELVTKELRSFPRDTACGSDGLRANHVKEMYNKLKGARRADFANALTKLVNLGLEGRLPASFSQYFNSAPLIPIAKKYNGIRPIAVGSTLRRLVSKCASKEFMGEASDYLQPSQLGVGAKDGCVAILHACRLLLGKYKDNPNLVMLKVDFKNAFNLVSREKMFEQVRRQCPSIARWVEYCYADQPFLFAGKEILKSSMGVQQGDPLGPVLFSLTLMPMIKKIAEKCPNLKLNAWYLDDGTIIGSPEDCAEILSLFQTEGKDYVLHLIRPSVKFIGQTWISTV